MKYRQIRNIGFIADPENWQELNWTLHNEPKGVVKYNPNEVKHGEGKSILDMFG